MAEDAAPPKVTMGQEYSVELRGERNPSRPTALRRRDLAVPVATLYVNGPSLEVDVRPLKGKHPASPQARVSAEQHHDLDAGTSPSLPSGEQEGLP